MSRRHAAPDEPDQVARLKRFKAKHPDIAIMTSFKVPTAFVGDEKVRRPSVGLLLDRLEEMTGDGPAGHALGTVAAEITCGKPNDCHYPACWIQPEGTHGYCDEGRNCVN